MSIIHDKKSRGYFVFHSRDKNANHDEGSKYWSQSKPAPHTFIPFINPFREIIHTIIVTRLQQVETPPEDGRTHFRA